MQDPSSYLKTQFPEQEQLKCPRCDSNNTKFCYYNNYNLSQPRHFCKNCKRYWTKGGALRNIPVGGGTRKNSKKPTTTTAIKKTPNPDPDPTRKVHEATTSSTTTTNNDNNNVSSSIIKPVTMTLGNLGGADNDPTRIYGLGQDRKMLDDDVGGSFSSLLASSHGQFGGLLEGLNPNLNGSALKMIHLGEFGQDLSSGLDLSTGRETGININGGGPGVGGGGGGNYLGMQIGGGGAAGVGDDDGEDSSWGGGSGGTDNGWPDLAIYTPGSNY